MSAQGSLYAVRTELLSPLPAAVADDLLTSLRVVAQGKRLVFEPAAVTEEGVSGQAGGELRRRIRSTERGWRGLMTMAPLLNPLRYGFYSLQLFSHKLLRWLAPLPLLALFASALLLQSSEAPFYRAAAAAQACFYGAALTVAALSRADRARARTPRLFAMPYYFCLSNLACLLALGWVVRGRRIERWEVRRTET